MNIFLNQDIFTGPAASDIMPTDKCKSWGNWFSQSTIKYHCLNSLSRMNTGYKTF